LGTVQSVDSRSKVNSFGTDWNGLGNFRL